MSVELKIEKVSLDRERRRRVHTEWRWWWCCCWQDVRNNNKFIIMYMRKRAIHTTQCSSSEENFLLLVRMWVAWLRLSPLSQKTISDRGFFLLAMENFPFLSSPTTTTFFFSANPLFTWHIHTHTDDSHTTLTQHSWLLEQSTKMFSSSFRMCVLMIMLSAKNLTIICRLFTKRIFHSKMFRLWNKKFLSRIFSLCATLISFA